MRCASGWTGYGTARPAARSASTACGARSVRSCGAQYRSGGLDPALALLLSSDPDSYLERAEALDRLSDRQAHALRDLGQAQRKLGQQRDEATRDLAELERSRAAVARHKRTVEAKLAEARRLLNSLPDAERDADRASRSGRDGGPLSLSGGSRPPRAPPPRRARRAASSACRTCGAPTGPPASTVRA